MAQECGTIFVKEYYNLLATSPDAPALTNMYTKFSQMVSEDGELVTGVDAIRAVLAKKALEQRKFRLSAVACYPSAYDSILVLVRGIVLTRESSKHFTQTFFLVPVKGFQGAPENTYYIYNDVLELAENVDLPTIPAVAVPEPVAAPEYVEPEPAYEEPEPEPEVVEEPVEEPEPEPTPEPVVAKPSPVAKPAPAPVKEEPKVVEPPRSGWAGIIKRKEAGAAPAGARPQVVVGGAVPNRPAVTAAPREERARGTSPVRRGTRGSSPPKFQKSQYSIYVRLTGLKPGDIAEADIERLFSKYGKVQGKTLQVEKGFCFVDFADEKGMDAALAASAKKEIVHGDRPLECNSRSNEKKPAPKGAKPDEKPRGLTNGTAAAAVRRK